MLDRPFRVKRCSQITNEYTRVTVIRWAIERTGEDTICYCDDVTFAYRIVDALNHEEENAERIATFNRRLHQDSADERGPGAAA